MILVCPVAAADPPGLALTPANFSASLREVLRIPPGCAFIIVLHLGAPPRDDAGTGDLMRLGRLVKPPRVRKTRATAAVRGDVGYFFSPSSRFAPSMILCHPNTRVNFRPSICISSGSLSATVDM